MTENERFSQFQRALWVLLVGIVGTIALVAFAVVNMPDGEPRRVFAIVAPFFGFAATGVACWRKTRPMAGDWRRAMMIAWLTMFAVVINPWWVGVLPMSFLMLANGAVAFSAMLLIGFALALLLFKWTADIDAREAATNRASMS